MSRPYIGARISLVSKSEVRYEGVLYNINTQDSTVALQNVQAFGTEGRRKDGPQIPPNTELFEYVIFKGADIKDLEVREAAPTPAFEDPAIVQSKTAAPQHPAQPHAQPQQTQTQMPAATAPPTSPPLLSPLQPQSIPPPSTAQQPAPKQQEQPAQQQQQQHQQQQQQHQQREGHSRHQPRRRGQSNGRGPKQDFHHQHQQQQQQSQPHRRGGRSDVGLGSHLLGMKTRDAVGDVKLDESATFDFASMNEKFDKAGEFAKLSLEDNQTRNPNTGEFGNGSEAYASGANADEDQVGGYSKSSFFDTISCDITDRENGKRHGLYGQKERDLNKETFGATGLNHGNNRYRNRRGGHRGRGRGRGRGGRGGRGGYAGNGRNDGGYHNNAGRGRGGYRGVSNVPKHNSGSGNSGHQQSSSGQVTFTNAFT
ncbi:Protein LSM14-like A [Hondaea fermentalgiana]|uniref:Protein LSM14-like A n=1 Tax=Hondaea fermentalgiana TaxID=2315210 RepID=A0A2R5GNR1_9STRA|nr:Protein LSM14-like A [Hondaea fermentalgiana]|eukprot:GBG31939.1 Protein LSM14-like A [Hondaea fermentalgiana]